MGIMSRWVCDISNLKSIPLTVGQISEKLHQQQHSRTCMKGTLREVFLVGLQVEFLEKSWDWKLFTRNME